MKTNSTYLKLGSNYFLFLIIILLFSFTNATNAQNKFSLDFSPAWDYPVNKFGNSALDNGFGFGININYKFLNALSVYGGWDWNKFSADEAFFDSDIYLIETGYVLGLNFLHPIKNSKLNYLIGGGTTYKHIETEDNDGKNVANSDFGFGWEANIGVQFSIAKKWNMTPSIRYRSNSRNFTVNDIKSTSELNYLSLKLAVCWVF